MQVGYTGKLPAYGDFVQGGGSLQACKNWSAWAEGGLAVARETPGFADVFLTSPIWRFSVAADVFAAAPVAGVFCPSMDKVGRLFPFAVLTELPAGVSPVAACTALGPWFDRLEASVLTALDPSATTDDLNHSIADPDPMSATSSGSPPLSTTDSFTSLAVSAEGEPTTVESDPLDLSDDEPEISDGVWITLGGIDAGAEGVSQSGAATSQLFSRLVMGEATHEL